MKTKLLTNPEPNNDFPCLMKHDESGMVVLFNNKECGTVLVAGNHPVGQYFKDWDIKAFKPLTLGQIVTLSND